MKTVKLLDVPKIEILPGCGVGEDAMQRLASDGEIVRTMISPEPLRALALIRGVFLTGIRDNDPLGFSGATVIMSEFDLWDDSSDAIGWSYYNGILSKQALQGEISTTPGVTVDGGRTNWLSVSAIALIPAIFRWDAWIIPSPLNFLGFISHEGFIDLAFASRFDAQKWKADMRDSETIVDRISPDRKPATR